MKCQRFIANTKHYKRYYFCFVIEAFSTDFLAIITFSMFLVFFFILELYYTRGSSNRVTVARSERCCNCDVVVAATAAAAVTVATHSETDSEPKFTDDLRTILRQFSDLRQSYDNWRFHRTFTTIVRRILRRHLTIGFLTS